ncbi:MAG: DUF4252 domain-containing protein [Bryobacterales bacterium]|nr:DUF4252 domain-containing protein [Bryobacterales bacterium]
MRRAIALRSARRTLEEAEEVTEVSLDATMLGFGGDGPLPEQVISNPWLVGARTSPGSDIRVFESAELQRLLVVVEPLRAQLNSSSWKKLVNVRSKKAGENVEIFMRMENGLNTGLTVIAGERKELAIIH